MTRNAFRPGATKARRRRRSVDRLKVDAAVERSSRYQRLLRQAAARSQEFQKQLDATQLGAWLFLEEALLELVTQSNEEYFKAGVVVGRSQRRSRFDAGASGRMRPRDTQLARTLVRLIRTIARQ